jgi:hypothetical protein
MTSWASRKDRNRLGTFNTSHSVMWIVSNRLWAQLTRAFQLDKVMCIQEGKESFFSDCPTQNECHATIPIPIELHVRLNEEARNLGAQKARLSHVDDTELSSGTSGKSFRLISIVFH